MTPSRSFCAQIVRYSLILGMLALLATISPSSLSAQTNTATLDGTEPHRVPGIVYVQFREGYNPMLQQGLVASSTTAVDQVQKIFQEIGMTRIEPFDANAWKNKVAHEVGIDRMYRVYYASNAHPLGVTLRLLQTGLVETASPQYIFSTQAKHIPNDPNYNQQWYLDTIHATEAWTITQGDPSIIIADVDEGVNYNHEDIAANMVDHGYDATNSTADCMPQTSQNEGSHGTETTGCFGAIIDNNKGIAGVAPKCRILGVKIANPAGQLTAGYEGIHIASIHGANVINCSWGGTIDPSALAFEQKFADEVAKNNQVLVASAGNYAKNNDVTPFYPANLTGALSVGASGLQNKPTSFTHFGTSVLVYAPGEHIATTTFPGNSSYDEYGNGADGIAGTSFSGPITAGICGLLMSLDNTLPADAVKKIVIESGDKMDPQGRPDLFTGLRVNALSAVNAIKSPSKPNIAAVGYKFEAANDSVLDQYDLDEYLDIELKNNSPAPGSSDMTVTLMPGAGYTWDGFDPIFTTNWPSQTTGTMDQKKQAFYKLARQVRRSRQFSEGHVTMRFVLNADNYHDTTSIAVPLSTQPGMDHRISAAHATCVKQLDARNAWAGFGYWYTTKNPETGNDTTFRITGFARRGLVGTTGQSRWELPRELEGAEAPALTIDALDSMHCWLAGGSNVTGSKNQVMYTDDGGETWGATNVPVLPKWIHFFDAMNGMFVGDASSKTFAQYTTTDGGVNWKVGNGITANITNEMVMHCGAYWRGDTGWFGGNAGVVHLTQNAGASWTSWQLDPTNTTYPRLKNVTAISFNRNQSLGFAVVRPFDDRFTDSAGLFVSLGTKGKSWTKIDIIDPNTNATDKTALPYSVTFKPESDTAIITTNHGVFKIVNTGSLSTPTWAWSYFPAPSSWNPSHSEISAAGTKNEYTISGASEGSGIVEFSTSALAPPAAVHTSATDARMDVIASPNPSSGVSQIYFSLAGDENVNVRLVDALGRTVQDVYSGFMAMGDHIVAIDAQKLPAGAYHCTIETAHGAIGEANIVLMH